MLQDKIWVPVGHPCWDIASKNTPYVRISVFPNVAPDRYKCRSAKHPTQAFSQFCCCSDGVICSLHIKAVHSLEADGAEKEDKTLQAKQKKKKSSPKKTWGSRGREVFNLDVQQNVQRKQKYSHKNCTGTHTERRPLTWRNGRSQFPVQIVPLQQQWSGKKKEYKVWWNFSAANSHAEVWGSFLSIYLTSGWIWGLPPFGFQLLIFISEPQCVLFALERFNCLRWLQSWDRGLACSLTHLFKHHWERKWAISFYDSWWKHFMQCPNFPLNPLI